MDAAFLLINQVTAPKVNVSNRSDNLQKSSTQSSSFAKIYDKELKNSSNQEATKDVESKGVFGSTNVTEQKEDIKDIHKQVEKIMDKLPMDEGFIDPALLQDPDILALLSQLPPQIQQLLTEFIQSGQSFEHLLAQTKQGSKEQLGLLLLTLYQLEKKAQLPDEIKQLDLLKGLQRQFNEVFKLDIQSQSTNATTLVSKLIETLEKKSNENANQLVAPSKIELLQNIQKVLNSDAANTNAGSKQDTEQGMFTGQATTQVMNAGEFDQLVASAIKDGGSVNRIQQYVLNVQQPNGTAASAEQILNQLNQIMKQSKFSALPNGTNQLMIRLHPEHLGSLMIKLTETNGEMMARIIASTATAKELIESNLHGLRHLFTTQNINVEKFEIQYQGDNPFEQAAKEKEQQNKQQNGDVEKENKKDEESKDETISFQDELVNLMA